MSLSLVCFSVQALGPHILNLVTLAALSHRLKKSKSGADSYIPDRGKDAHMPVEGADATELRTCMHSAIVPVED